MGCYVNVENGTKEDWLVKFGKPVSLSEVKEFDDFEGDALIVALVDNGFFTAAGVMYSPGELKAFTDPLDSRPVSYYRVAKKDLETVSPLKDYFR